jgi:hypothetical protein
MDCGRGSTQNHVFINWACVQSGIMLQDLKGNISKKLKCFGNNRQVFKG